MLDHFIIHIAWDSHLTKECSLQASSILRKRVDNYLHQCSTVQLIDEIDIRGSKVLQNELKFESLLIIAEIMGERRHSNTYLYSDSKCEVTGDAFKMPQLYEYLEIPQHTITQK